VHSTSLTLLQDLQNLGNHERWAEFHSIYAPLIVCFAQKIGCSGAIAQGEVLQETMISLTRVLPGFRYDRKLTGFRGLLYTIVRNHVRSAWRRQRAFHLQADLPEWDLAGVSDDSPQANPEAMWEKLWRQNLLLRALERVRKQVLGTTYESFVEYVIKGRPAGQVARELGIEVNGVHQHRHRMVRLLREQVRLLQEDVGEVTDGKQD